MNPPELTDPAALAVQRLSASRLALRAQLVPSPRTGAPEGAGAGRGRLTRRLLAAWRLARTRLHGSPVGLWVLDRVQSGWQRSPWRLAGVALAAQVQAHAVPWVRRHPVASLSLATCAGAALVAGRSAWMEPWVLPQARALPGRLGRWTLRQLSTPSPLSSLLLGLLVVGTTPAASEPDREVASPPTPTSTPKGVPDDV